MDSYKDIELTDLITMVCECDDAAFAELVSRYTPMMNKVALGFVGPRLCYDEAFSEACVALHRAAVSYDVSKSAEVTFGLYARICVYRRICDLLEKNIREIIPTVDLDVSLISAESNIEQRLVARERMTQCLEIAKKVLSEYEYSVFLCYIRGDSTAEIAKKLGRDLKSVENAKSRMLRHLREKSDIFSDV